MALVAFKFTVERFDGMPYRVFRGLLGCPALECKLVGEATPQDTSRKVFKVTVQGTKKNIQRYRDVLICIEPVMGSFDDISFAQFNKGDEEDGNYTDFDIAEDIPDTENLTSPTGSPDESVGAGVVQESLCLEPEEDSEEVMSIMHKSPRMARAESVMKKTIFSEDEEEHDDGDSEIVMQVLRRSPTMAPVRSVKKKNPSAHEDGASEVMQDMRKSPTMAPVRSVKRTFSEHEDDSQEPDSDWDMVMSQSILSRRGNW